MLHSDSKYATTPLLHTNNKKKNKSDRNNLKFWFIIPLICIVALLYTAYHGNMLPTESPLVQQPKSYMMEEPSYNDLSLFMEPQHQTITVSYNSYEMSQAIGYAEPGSPEWIAFHVNLLRNAGYDFDEVMDDPDITVRFEAHDNNHLEFEQPVTIETRQPKPNHRISQTAKFRGWATNSLMNPHSISGGPGLQEFDDDEEEDLEVEEEDEFEDEAKKSKKGNNENGGNGNENTEAPLADTTQTSHPTIADPTTAMPLATPSPTTASPTTTSPTTAAPTTTTTTIKPTNYPTRSAPQPEPEPEPVTTPKPPKPSKAPKTPRPTAWKSPKPTKPDKTPRPTDAKTPRPTKEVKVPKTAKPAKTPKPKPAKTPKPVKIRTTTGPKPTKAPKGKAPKPTKPPTKFDYKPPKVKACPPPGPNGVIPGRPDCYDEWIDPGMHCFNAVTYRKPSDIPGEQWLSVDCGSTPGTVRTGCTSNNGNTGYPIYGTATTYDEGTGFQGCVTTLDTGDRSGDVGDVWVFLSARCCWPTDEDGRWEANDVDLSVTVLGKAESNANEGHCLVDSCEDVAQSKAGHTVTTDCSANQGIAGVDGVESVSDTFVSPKLTGNTCQALRYDAGLIDLETICTTYHRVDAKKGDLECVTHEGGDYSVGLGSYYLACPDNGSGEGSNWKMVGCNANIEGSPSDEQCENDAFGLGTEHDWGFSSSISGVGLYKTPYFSGEACRGGGNNNEAQSMSAKCCRVKKN